jgi:glycerol uptake facilitator-like aquaporin
MVYAGVQNSGGYFNPAATIAVWLLGRCPSADLPGCLVPQVVAAAAAAVAALSLEPERFGLKEKGTVWPQDLVAVLSFSRHPCVSTNLLRHSSAVGRRLMTPVT